MFAAEAGLAAIRAEAPETASASEEVVKQSVKGDVGRTLDPDAFSMLPKLPFDIAVMEKVSGARVIPSNWGWSDVGSWRAFHKVCQKDDRNNSVLGDASIEDAENLLVRSDGVTVTALAVRDLVIVATSKAMFVAPHDRSEELRRIVEQLKSKNRDDLL